MWSCLSSVGFLSWNSRSAAVGHGVSVCPVQQKHADWEKVSVQKDRKYIKENEQTYWLFPHVWFWNVLFKRKVATPMFAGPAYRLYFHHSAFVCVCACVRARAYHIIKTSHHKLAPQSLLDFFSQLVKWPTMERTIDPSLSLTDSLFGVDVFFILQYYTVQAGTCIVHTAGLTLVENNWQENAANMNVKDNKQANVMLQFLEENRLHYTVIIISAHSVCCLDIFTSYSSSADYVQDFLTVSQQIMR